jgi:hypothetical protein
MSNKAKILILLILLSFSTIFLLIFSSKPIKISDIPSNKNQKIKTVDLVKLESNYKDDVKKILIEYEQSIGSSSEKLISTSSINDIRTAGASENKTQSEEDKSAKIAELKNKLLKLTVPPVSALMDLHVKLVLAFSKMENYLTSNNIKEYKESTESIKLAKNNYQWLNQ